MKKLFFFISCLVISSSDVYSRPILSMTKWDGGKHGYNYVSANLVTSSSGTEGWVIECHSPGFERCARPASVVSNDLDYADIQFAEELVGRAELSWDEGFKSGTDAILVQIPNETFLRQYVVTWFVSDRRVHIEVVRNDVSI